MEKISELIKTPEMSCIEEDNKLLFFPVRHHSPVCSYQLVRTIESYRPQAILIEGPSDANDLIPILADEETKLPAAIYYFYKDKKKLVNEDAEDYKCYYPFLYSSPEYNAIITAKRLGIKAEFIDLPYYEIMINTAAESGLRSRAKQDYADDSKLTSGDFYRALCDKTGIRNFEEFWEKYFEIGGLSLSTEEFLRQMHTYCLITRENTDEDELKSDGTLARESFMAAKIIEALKAYERVLVVTGGFHSSGLLQLVKNGKTKPPALHKIADDCRGAYPAAYSYEAADALHGYASGMAFPYFYDSVFRELSKRGDPHGVYNDLTLDLLVRTAKASAKKDVPVAISDVTAAHTMMNGLAALRGVKECGMYELFDGVTSSFIKGEKTVSSSLPLDLLTKLATGDKVGHIGDKSHVPPLISDFEEQCRNLRLKYETAVPQTVECGLFTTSRGLPLSRFLHRLDYLGTGFAELKKGADLRAGKDKSRVREEWKYRRTPSVDSALIDHTIDGVTIEEACRNIAYKEIESSLRCEKAAETAVDCFVMGISIEQEQKRLTEITAADGDFFSVGKGVGYFEMLYRLQKLYEYDDDSTFVLMDMCLSKLISALPSMANVPDELADKCISVMKRMYELSNTILKDKSEDFHTALTTLTEAKEKHPAVYGAAMGLLCQYGKDYQNDAVKAMKGFLSGSLTVKKQGAEYLKGLFSCARDIMFSENDFLVMADELITGMDSDDFIEILPQLRLAFGYFTPQEISDTAKAVAALYDTDSDKVLYAEIIDERLYEFARQLDNEITAVLNTKGEPT